MTSPREFIRDSHSAKSFRDPDGYLIELDKNLIRVVAAQAAGQLTRFLQTKTFANLVETGKVVGTRPLTDQEKRQLQREYPNGTLPQVEPGGTWLEHERVWFETYPHEWPPEMLHAAARLTLEICESALKEGYSLKDATPYNVLFQRGRPVFVDILSFEVREAGDQIWLPYGQFIRTFVLPLLAEKYLKTSVDSVFLTHRDGLAPEELYERLGPIRRWLPPTLTLVSLPALLSSRNASGTSLLINKTSSISNERRDFILRRIYSGLSKTVDKLMRGNRRSSIWSRYPSCAHLSTGYVTKKRLFVENVLAESRPQRVLDLGCNTGDYSLIAARSGAEVIASDQDPVVVGDLWKKARQHDLPITPLVLNLARPTPGLGWKNAECRSFMDRARKKFDLVLVLALIHHLVASERIPVDSIAQWLSDLTNDGVILEYISKADPMFQRISHTRLHSIRGYDQPEFESAINRWFRIVRVECVEPDRRYLYFLRNRNSSNSPAQQL